MTAEMTSRERVAAAFEGAPVDRVPLSFWRHFPEEDRRGESLAAATVRYQRRFPADLVKITPTGMYSVIDYGVTVEQEWGIGTTRYVSGPITTAADLLRIPRIDLHTGMLGEMVDAVRLARAAIGDDVPILQTVFSPLTMLSKVAGGRVRRLMDADPDALRDVASRLCEDALAFSRACLRAGADGVFFAVQHKTGDADLYADFGEVLDVRFCRELLTDGAVIVLHLHDEPDLSVADRYGVQAVNWDEATGPTVTDALGLTRRGVISGMSPTGAIRDPAPDRIARQIAELIGATRGRRLLIGPGCTLMPDTRDEQLDAVIATVRAKSPT
jgi:uroporphyrinogen decarboxylase